MKNIPECPQCNSTYTYADGNLWICPECAHEWSIHTVVQKADSLSLESAIRDAFGTVLHDGDSVTVIKDLKIKGSSSVVKVGTKVKSIRLVESSNGHNIACKIEGIGAINLKSEFVKKS